MADPQTGRFQPGQSGNPGGRPRGIERRVRDLLKDDWDAIILAMADIALGRLPPGITGETTVKVKDRVDAAKLVLDRGWGKARTVIDIQADIQDGALGALDIESLDEATLAHLEDTITRIREKGGVIDAKSTDVRLELSPMVDVPMVDVPEKKLEPAVTLQPLPSIKLPTA